MSAIEIRIVGEGVAECDFGEIGSLQDYLRLNKIHPDTAPECILVGREWADEIEYSESFDEWCGVRVTVSRDENDCKQMQVGASDGMLTYTLHETVWADQQPGSPLYVGQLECL
ncbi:hypothetical protein NJBCHELONAE_48350 [Mycobacteroides chelonae]|uniref:hypothetical protein n=1 Tax=Mycobacteroides chelonae TaxID=1774 RepID=UPI0021DDFDD7|nr:hypothetical protein [Mycobacteroides chelonae]GLE59522.1 hypothetical protein NJBCHELONAE_48350 [Mycobacteroides chelonae]